MTEAATVETGAETAQVTETPKPLGEVSAAEYRERREKGDSGQEAPKPAETPAPNADAKADEQPDPASEAGKALQAKRGSLQSRIDELTKEKGTTQRERDALAAEAAELRARLARMEGKPAGEQPAADANKPEYYTRPRPKQEDFDDQPDPYAAWVEAIADWKADEKIAAREMARSRDDSSRSFVAAQARVETAAKEAHADFDAVIDAFAQGGHRFTPVAAEAILHHPLGHEIAYHLAKNPDDNAKLANLPPALAYVELGKVVAKLEAAAASSTDGKGEQKPAPVSKAPAPIPAVSGAAPVVTTIEQAAEAGDAKAYRARREAAMKGKR